MSLTSHQRTVLNYIVEFQHKRGYSPSLADLALAFGVSSKNAIAKVVNVLVREGQIEKDPKGRIKIIDKPSADAKPEPMMLHSLVLSLPVLQPLLKSRQKRC